MAWSWLILGPSSPFLGLPWAVLTHLGPVFGTDGSQDEVSWGRGGVGQLFKALLGGQNGAQNRVILVSCRGLILVMIFSSLRNDFYGSRVPFWGVIFCDFFACTHT